MPQAAAQRPRIFICYRHDDSSGHAGRLFDRLRAHFGVQQIFMDLARIEPGEDFVRVIENAVGSCEVLLAVIGRTWLTSPERPAQQLDDPNDFVRLEIAVALAHDILVIPVLVQGARMPRPQELPEDILPLARRQAHELSDLRWDHDVDRLIDTLERALSWRSVHHAAPPEPGGGARPRDEVPFGGTRPGPASQAPAGGHGPTPSGTKWQFTTEHVAAPATPSRRTCLVIIGFAALALILVGLVLAWLNRVPPDNTNQPAHMASPAPTLAASPAPDSTRPPRGMVYVPGGSFRMGSDSGDEYERPAHAVSVGPFYIDQYEVTNEGYAEFVRETGHRPPQGWKGGAYPAGEARRPVTGVTWDDAAAYAKWAGKRLPTEEEWEFAARGTDGRRYPWGDEWRAGLANADGASRTPADVGASGGASPYGLRDAVGNVWEWTASRWVAYPGARAPEQPAGDSRVIRGGSYLTPKELATTTYRRGHPARGRWDYGSTGFRCAQDVAGPPR